MSSRAQRGICTSLVIPSAARDLLVGPGHGLSRLDTVTYIDRHDAGIAQLVEHNLAKVGVAGSSPVSRSRWKQRGSGGRRSLFSIC